MKMKRIEMALAAFTLSFCSMADTHTWKSRAAGGWNDGESYEEGVAPEDGDTVIIPEGRVAVAEDGDMALISSLEAVLFAKRSSKIVIDISGDHEVLCHIRGEGNLGSDNNAGILEKNGSGTLWLKNDSGISQYNSNIIVNDGILRLPSVSYSNRNQTYYKMTVNRPGVVYLPTSSDTPQKSVNFRTRLYGDGLVTNVSSAKVQFYPIGSNASSIPEFSGKVCGPVSMSAPASEHWQDLTGTGSLNSETITLGDSLSLGLADFGGSSGNSVHYGSFGCGKIVFDGEGVLRYLGTGGMGHTAFEDGNSLKVAHIDAGKTGGLRLMGDFNFAKSSNILKRLVLSGDNENECTVEGCMANHADGAVYLTKKGSGIWKLASETAFSNGVIAVEEGTLRYASIRNKGVGCSLGAATILRSEHTGAIEDSSPVPYAYLLGSPAAIGAMEYVGGNEAVCDDRPFAVKGFGRIDSAGKPLVLCGGAEPILPGTNTLYLGGAASRCVMNNISDGVGKLKVVKDGAGEWSIGGNLAFSAGIDVKEGVLTIGNSYCPGSYTRYRLTIRSKNEGGSGNAYFNIGRIALFNAAGEVQNAVLEYNPAANTDKQTSLLEPRQTAFATPGKDLNPVNFYNHREKAPEYSSSNKVYNYIDDPMLNVTNVFATLSADANAYARVRHTGREGTSSWPNLAAPNFWPTVEFRLPAGADPVVAYDIGARFGSAAKSSATLTAAKKNWQDCIGSWTLYGSVDGKEWTELSSVTSNDLRGVATTDCSWMSDGASYATADGWIRPGCGWSIPSRPEGGAIPEYVRFASVPGTVSVAAGAVLRTRESIAIDSLALGESNGVIDGFSFASDGSLEVGATEGSSGDGRVRLSAEFRNCSGLGNLRKWKLLHDGKPMVVCSADENGVTLAPVGMRVVVR